MTYPNILLWGNNTFHKMNTWNDLKIEPKYLQIGISGTIDSTTVFTYKEVMSYTNNQAKACKDLLEIYNTYYNKT